MNTPRPHIQFGLIVCLVVLASIDGIMLVAAFAEEPIGFRDPATGITYAPANGYPEISAFHDDLTLVLALAAGFTITDSRALEIANQLVDSEMLPGSVFSYTNCGGAFAPAPDPSTLYPGCGANCARLIWPQWSNMKNPATCITSRFGPFSPFFHFPHRTGALGEHDLGALRDWAAGKNTTLVGYEAYAWGRNSDLVVMQAQHRYTRTVTITTTIQAGSLQAFGTYLHSLADSYSHEACIAVLDSIGMEWGTHTVDNTFPECKYNPNNPQADDVHGVEFGNTPESQRTIDAARDVYAKMSARGPTREGIYFPLALTTPLVISGTTTTLAGAITSFVQNWSFDTAGAANRRAYADKMAQAILAQPRTLIQREYLPWLSK